MGLFSDRDAPKKDLATILAHISNVMDAATGNDGEKEFVWYNKWRMHRFINKERKQEYGISTGRADWPQDVVPHSRYLREHDAQAIEVGHNAIHHLLQFTATIEENKEADNLSEITQEALKELHARLSDPELFRWALADEEEGQIP